MSSTTVHVKNISSQTSEKEVRDFFSFCGKISSISVHSDAASQSATVTFEKPTAAKTALLLDNTQLGPSLVSVSSEGSLDDDKTGYGSSASAALGAEHDDVEQEDKPRSRIVAEYLAHGYTISDAAISRAIALDNQHGVSQRFTATLQSFDQRLHATENAKQIDAKYGVTDKVNQGWAGLSSYFEKALGTPSGQKVLDFYQQGSKQVLDVHNEAKRLAQLRSGKSSADVLDSTVGQGASHDQSLSEKTAHATTGNTQL